MANIEPVNSITVGPGTELLLSRWERVRDLIVLLMFATTTISSLLFKPEVPGSQGIALLLSAVFVGWYAFSYTRSYRHWFTKSLPGNLLYFALGLALWGVLILLDGPYLMYIFVLLTTVYTQVPLSWAIGLSFLATVLGVLRQVSLTGRIIDPVTMMLVFAALSAAGLALFMTALIRQSEERARLLIELQATRSTLAVAERQAGILQERQRVAHEIHDTLAQAFIGIVAHLEAADGALPTDSPVAGGHIDQARSMARQGLTDARHLVQNLRPDVLEQAPLPEAIQRVASSWAQQTGIDTNFLITGTPRPLPTELDTTLLRGAQEALSNIHKHAHATRVALTLSYLEDMVILDVNDDGAGFDPISIQARSGDPLMGGFGLQAMRERADTLGGKVTIETEPGKGTTVAIEMPLVADANDSRE